MCYKELLAQYWMSVNLYGFGLTKSLEKSLVSGQSQFVFFFPPVTLQFSIEDSKLLPTSARWDPENIQHILPRKYIIFGLENTTYYEQIN